MLLTKTLGWYTLFMPKPNPKAVRRKILIFLYENFLTDPLQMLTPTDFTDNEVCSITELIPNIHYLHERNYVELMLGYTPPLFAATRISNAGVDLYEDSVEFDRLFPPGVVASTAGTVDLVEIMLTLVEQAEALTLSGKKQEWLINDIDFLRQELIQPDIHWRSDYILKRLQWVDVLLDKESPNGIPAYDSLKSILHDKLL